MLLKASNCCKYLHTLSEKEYYINGTAAFMKANLFVITTRYGFYGSFSKASYVVWMAMTTKTVRLTVTPRIRDCSTTCWIWSKQTWSSRHGLCETTQSNLRNWHFCLFVSLKIMVSQESLLQIHTEGIYKGKRAEGLLSTSAVLSLTNTNSLFPSRQTHTIDQTPDVWWM